jgi:hypothetical protein
LMGRCFGGVWMLVLLDVIIATYARIFLLYFLRLDLVKMLSVCGKLSVLVAVVSCKSFSFFLVSFVRCNWPPSVFTQFTYAQNSSIPTPSASTFYLTETETQFSLNVANASDDVHFYFASPAYSWVAVGFGQEMENSLMLVMYANQRSDNVTISPRIGRKNGEPTFTDKIKLEMLPGTMLDGNESMMIVRALCRNCRSHFDVKDTKQNMIYAFGHGALFSNSPSANLKRHVRYGHFSIDMVAATGTGGVPAKSSTTRGVKEIGTMARDYRLPGTFRRLAAQRVVRRLLQEHPDPYRRQHRHYGFPPRRLRTRYIDVRTVQSRKSCPYLTVHEFELIRT